MARRTQLVTLMALLVLTPFVAACGAAEEPAPEAPAAAPAPAAPAADPEPAAPEPEEPAAPEIVGNILLTNDNFDWVSSTTETAVYEWTARLQNDTTANLRIVLKFQFLDESDGVVKTETRTVTLAPAESRSFREQGEMSYDDSLKVIGFLADYTHEIATD